MVREHVMPLHPSSFKRRPESSFFLNRVNSLVIPAKAGIHFFSQRSTWIPAFAGMTPIEDLSRSIRPGTRMRRAGRASISASPIGARVLRLCEPFEIPTLAAFGGRSRKQHGVTDDG